MKLAPALIATVFGIAPIVALVQNQQMLALPATQVNNIARQFTVVIDGQNPGSGVIIGRKGNTYTVLTARHVVATPDEYGIVAPDGKRLPINYNTAKFLPGVDLATLEFISTNTYQIAKLGDSSKVIGGSNIYVAGFPTLSNNQFQGFFAFTSGQVVANSERPLADGYALLYSNNTLPGMSGGPVLNEEGEVIGIHGRGLTEKPTSAPTVNPDVSLKTGHNLAIPINTYLRWAASTTASPIATAASSPIPVGQPTADDVIVQAADKMKKKDYRGVIADLDQLIARDSNNAEAYKLRAEARWNLNEHQSALADFTQAIRTNPKDMNAYQRRAVLYESDLKDYQAALADLSQIIRIKPNDADGYRARAGFHMRRQNFQVAIADLNQAVLIAPNDTNAYSQRAGVYESNLKDYQAALADLSQIIRIKPNDADGYRARAGFHMRRQNSQAAMTDLNQAISAAPNDIWAYLARAYVLVLSKDYMNAIADYDRVIRIAPQHANTYKLRGNLRIRLKDYKGAMSDAEEMIRVSPIPANNSTAAGNNRSEAYELRGNVRLQMRDYLGAIADYDTAIRLDSTYNLSTYVNRGRTHFYLKDFKSAIIDYEKIIRTDFGSKRDSLVHLAFAHNYRGEIREKLNDYRGALVDYQRAVAVASDFQAYASKQIGSSLLLPNPEALEIATQNLQRLSRQLKQ
jgi:tetratricopeptide (TPR) repeat protein